MRVLYAAALGVMLGSCYNVATESRRGTTDQGAASGSKAPATGQGGSEDSSKDQAGTPVASTGTYLADYDNTRLRCDYQQAASNSYNALCLVVVRQSDGRELQAQNLKAGVTLTWNDPVAVRGVATFDQCVPAAGLLAYHCHIKA